MNRRQFIVGIGAAASASLAGCALFDRRESDPLVRTVLGEVAADEIGIALPHEHVLVDFIGAAQASRNRYNRDEVVRVALPYLKQVKELGCETLFECTPAFIGRDPALLRELALASEMNLVTNTGYYGAAKNKFLPAHALTETAGQLAERWIREAQEGIEGTGIRPGFMKIGVDAGPLSELHARLVSAAAQAHWATGLTIAAHTGNGAAAMQELDILEKNGIEGEAFVWVHAQSESNEDLHARAAERGAWVEFDGVSPESIAQHVKLVMALRARGFLQQVLVSHDAGWYHVGEEGGGRFRPFDALFAEFIPALRQAGLSNDEIRLLIEKNPQRAFAIRVRGRG